MYPPFRSSDGVEATCADTGILMRIINNKRNPNLRM